MLRLLLDRLLPARPKEEPISIKLPKTGLIKQMQTILVALNDADITTSDALKLMNLTVAQSKIMEFEELSNRVNALENSLNSSREI